MPGTVHRRWGNPVFAGLTVIILAGSAVAFWAVANRGLTHPLARGTSAYRAGEWAVAGDTARQILTKSKDDPAALRLFARSSARLGRNSAAIAIYQNRLDPSSFEAEDYLLLGILQQQQKNGEGPMISWKKALDLPDVTPEVLEELARVNMKARRWDFALLAAERLGKIPGWEARASMMLGIARVELNNITGAAQAFQRALDLDPKELDKSQDSAQLKKLIARTFLRVGQPADAQYLLEPIQGSSPDSETAWLLSRVFLQQGDKSRALEALKRSGSYRASNPLEPDPSPYVGEAQCEPCHQSIYRDSLKNRHTQTYYRGPQLNAIPLPGKPLPDPEDPQVTQAYEKASDGTLHAKTKVGDQVYEAVIEYAFGTADRYLTLVSHDDKGAYHIGRLSYYQTKEGTGWSRSGLDRTHPNRAHPAEFQGEAIGVRDGLVRCLYCHVTNPRTGTELIGPETADRAIGCERCHGPGGNHIAALKLGLPDLAISNPAAASPGLVTAKQCNDCHILDKGFRKADPDDPGWTRSQGVGWTLSRCNTESNGAFGCITCHDPHKTAVGTPTAEYESKCLVCHSATPAASSTAHSGPTSKAPVGVPSRVCPINASSGCINCHMPKIRVDSLHMDLADHNIRIHRSKN